MWDPVLDTLRVTKSWKLKTTSGQRVLIEDLIIFTHENRLSWGLVDWVSVSNYELIFLKAKRCPISLVHFPCDFLMMGSCMAAALPLEFCKIRICPTLLTEEWPLNFTKEHLFDRNMTQIFCVLNIDKCIDQLFNKWDVLGFCRMLRFVLISYGLRVQSLCVYSIFNFYFIFLICSLLLGSCLLTRTFVFITNPLSSLYF